MSEHTVAILEDHPLLAGITRELIEGILNDCQVLIFPSLAQLINSEASISYLVIDLHLEDADEKGLLNRLKELYPDIPGIVYTSQSDAREMAEEYGYTFLDKRSDSGTFFDTLARTLESAGLTVALEPVNEQPNDKRYSHQSSIIAPGANKPLTLKQVEVMECCCKGLSAKETARELNLGVETIRAHMSEIFLRLQVKNAPQAVEVYTKAKRLAAMKSGLFSENSAPPPMES